MFVLSNLENKVIVCAEPLARIILSGITEEACSHVLFDGVLLFSIMIFVLFSETFFRMPLEMTSQKKLTSQLEFTSQLETV